MAFGYNERLHTANGMLYMATKLVHNRWPMNIDARKLLIEGLIEPECSLGQQSGFMGMIRKGVCTSVLLTY